MFNNQDLFFTYTEYEHEFEIETREKIATHGYNNVNLRISDLKGNTNIPTITNVNWAPKLGQNLLSIILLAKKSVEMFLRKASQPSEIDVDDKVFGLADIIENQYVIWLVEHPKPAIVSRVTVPTIET